MARRSRFRNAAILFNPQAGSASRQRRRQLERAAGLLGVHGIACTLVPTTGPGTAEGIAREQAAAGRDLVIACGGDGTVNEVANGLAHSGIPMALLPAGTANILAKDLGLPWNIVQAAELIPHGEVHRIALGKAGERYFVCVAGAGADAAVIRNFNRFGASKARLGMLLGVLEGFHQLFTYGFPEFNVEIAGRTYAAAQVLALRTRAQSGPIRVTQTARLPATHLEVLTLPRRWRLYYLAAFLADLGGSLASFPGVEYFDTDRVRVTPADSPVGYEVDGEWAGSLPVEITIAPGALDLVVPAGRWERL